MAKNNKKPADAAKDKAAKQKKIAIGLVCLLVVAMAYAVHTMSSIGGGSAASKPQAADPATSVSTTSVVTTPATASPAAPSLSGDPVAADPAAVVSGATPAGSTQLLAAVSPPADAGQLQSFSRFSSKDPFAGGGSAPVSGGSSGGSSPGSSPGSPPAVPPAPPTPPPTSAVITVNGLPEQVSTLANFPVSNPNPTSNGLFELRSLTAKTATIAVVGGSYASGSQTLTLTVNKPVTLVNTADGTRYTLLLNPQGTAAPSGAAAPAASGTTPTPTTTTPATTGG